MGWPAYLWVRLNDPDLERGMAPRSDIKNCFLVIDGQLVATS